MQAARLGADSHSVQYLSTSKLSTCANHLTVLQLVSVLEYFGTCSTARFIVHRASRAFGHRASRAFGHHAHSLGASSSVEYFSSRGGNTIYNGSHELRLVSVLTYFQYMQKWTNIANRYDPYFKDFSNILELVSVRTERGNCMSAGPYGPWPICAPAHMGPGPYGPRSPEAK